MINIVTGDGATKFIITGDLDQHSMQEFSEAVTRELSNGNDMDFVLDLERTRFVDSGCLGIISQANRELTARGRRLRLTNVQGSVAATLNVTSLDKILDIELKN